MVKEFTDLQGIMGGLYARVEGLPTGVSDAIYEHYRPGTLEDSSPQTLLWGDSFRRRQVGLRRSERFAIGRFQPVQRIRWPCAVNARV
jgi:hypothetical protein